MYWRGVLLGSAALLSACSWFGGGEKTTSVPTLSDLAPATLPQAGSELPAKALPEVVEQYRSALQIAEDPDTRNAIMRRLAGLEMVQSEQRQIEQNSGARYYDRAVAQYRDLLARYPNRPDNDRLLYQIAKACELDGRIDDSMAALQQLVEQYPDSEHYTEAQFRRAEIFFSRGDYADAGNAYQAVVASRKDSPYYRNAIYMYGWSLFKRNRYYDAIEPFTQIMDQLLLDSGELDGLERSSLEMAQDSLRVMSLAFSYLDGAATIDEVYDALGERPYQHLLYDSLGELYLHKERFRDSAETYRAYVQRYPKSDYSPRFSVKMIDVYSRGNFPSMILPAKQAFVSNYGINSKYWALKNETVRDSLRPHLHSYLIELAKHHHALAQELQKRKKNVPSKREIAAAFVQASDWYAQFVATFANDAATPDMAFLMAESLFEAGELSRAIDVYEQVGYQFAVASGDEKKGAEAGYSAVLAYDRYIPTIPEGQQQDWRLAKILSAQRFSQVYRSDARAAPVLTKAAEELLALERYNDAIETAAQITQWQPNATGTLRRTAWLVQGHSYFQLANFAGAETAYQRALALMQNSEHNPVRQHTVERLAASVYKRAEQLLAQGDSRGAISEFLRVRDLAPGNETAIAAQYDAAAQLLALKDWPQAKEVLVDFRQRYPNHALTAGISAKLAEAYQQMENWEGAARELSLMAMQNTSANAGSEVHRQSLYLAAELFEKAQNWPQAIEHYQRYLHTWPEPFDMAVEARYRLSELYRQTEDRQQRDIWLRKLIATHRAVGAAGTERSQYLAGFSAIEFAEQEFRRFQQLALTLPLKQSLKNKRTALETTLAAYNDALEIGVAEFATQANYRIGELYAQLARDLLASERPALDELALEQYELLLEEQAFPFEEKSIAVHEANVHRTRQGIYDSWVKRSFGVLGQLLPGRYIKREQLLDSARDEGPNVYNRLAVIKRLSGEFFEAEQLYIKALQVDPNCDVAHRNLAILYDLYMGDLVNAQNHYQAYQQLQIEPDRQVDGWLKDIDRRMQAVATLENSP